MTWTAKNSRELVDEFIQDVEAAFGHDTDDGQKPSPELIGQRLQRECGWPDLARTYEKAKRSLAKFDSPEPLKIKRWLRTGEIGPCNTDVELVQAAGGKLDHACAWDICGEVIFEGEDGVVYVGNVEFIIGEYNPELLAELEKELEHEQDDSAED
jgi:hypothetical protein